MPSHRSRSPLLLVFLSLLLPLPAQALTPVGPPLAIADDAPFCSFVADLEVIATPKGGVRGHLGR